ncbi:MAG: hypothetical protein L0332_24710 [Chloroflexi bacterium]|nr:hypothetical protein [Chloroflexota bacterium]MCI0577048.1 hypothetical protein [Chloroflexota bacterium]MCI0649985.1 hypothetical protein [Chloroflexota bacterium]MCI0729898.1 hypothetical protein [Chloroflexota bacterium]
MKLPIDATIAPAKLNQYLLVPKKRNDKSRWLAGAGYTLKNWTVLENDLRQQILSQEAVLVEVTSFGETYEISSELTGPNGKTLAIRTIWLQESDTGQTKFVTLFPDKRRNE